MRSESRQSRQDGPVRSIAIVGGGVAGLNTLAQLRSRGHDGRITVIAHERGYDRPPLSKELLTATQPRWLDADLGIEHHALADQVIAAAAVSLQASESADGPYQITTEDGDRVTADAVVIAVGGTPVRPPHLPESLVLSSWADVMAIRDAVATHQPLVVAGGGWLAAEIASALAGHDLPATWIHPRREPLEGVVGAVVGARIGHWFDGTPVTRMAGARAAGFADGMIVATGADGAVTRVPAATVIAATGVVPATHWLPGWLPRDNAGHIVTDEAGHVIAGVYAVGDAAVRRDRHWGWVRGGHWTSAMSQPGAVAAAILGAAAPPAHAPYVFSTLMGHELGLLGDPRLATDTAPPAGRADGGSTRPRDDDDVDSPGQARAGAAPAESSSAAPPDAAARIIENAEVPGWTAQWVREADGATTAVLAVDQPRSIVSARKALRDGPSATWQPPVRTPR